MASYIQVVTTTDSQEVAGQIAEVLISRRLAACVQISGPITSQYYWEGRVEKSQEWLCTAKTRQELFPRIEAAIQEAHNYDVPEILANDIVAGSERYLRWVDEEVSQAQ